jgi:hypothetical protein
MTIIQTSVNAIRLSFASADNIVLGLNTRGSSFSPLQLQRLFRLASCFFHLGKSLWNQGNPAIILFVNPTEQLDLKLI